MRGHRTWSYSETYGGARSATAFLFRMIGEPQQSERLHAENCLSIADELSDFEEVAAQLGFQHLGVPVELWRTVAENSDVAEQWIADNRDELRAVEQSAFQMLLSMGSSMKHLRQMDEGDAP